MELPAQHGRWKIGPALATGNTVILKPSARTPLSALRFAEVAADTFPPGVVNVVSGTGAAMGDLLVGHPKVRMVSVTGDTETGKHIAQLAADRVKRLHLELGGKAPVVVFDDADLEAADNLKTFGTGTAARTARRAAGDRRAESTTRSWPTWPARSRRSSGATRPRATTSRWARSSRGPGRQGQGMVDRRASGAEIVSAAIARIGRRLLRADGHRRPGPEERDRPGRGLRAGRHGPALQRRGPGHRVGQRRPFGLAASVWSGDIGKAMRVAKAIQFGNVWINTHFMLVSEMPHGGVKESGYGKDQSQYAIEDYTVVKHVMIKLRAGRGSVGAGRGADGERQTEQADRSELQAGVLGWYAAVGRELGFRGTRDPYAILVSEVMAQQTQIARAEQYWRVWMARFPTIEALAAATPADVLRAWQGLGYDRRALNLLRCARGSSPCTAAGCRPPSRTSNGCPASVRTRPVHWRRWRSASGSGRWTSTSAGSSGASSAGPDALGRHGSAPGRGRRGAGRPPGRWTHALMDLGATLCRIRAPRCEECPARPVCGRRRRPRARRGERPRAIARDRERAFTTTRRWLRGRILDRLRAADEGWVAFEGAARRARRSGGRGGARGPSSEGMVELRRRAPLGRLPAASSCRGAGRLRRRCRRAAP